MEGDLAPKVGVVLGDFRVDDAKERTVAALRAPSVVEAGLHQVVLAAVERIVRGATEVRADVVVVDGGHGGPALEFLLGCLQGVFGGGLRSRGCGLRHRDDLEVSPLEFIPYLDIGGACRSSLCLLSCGVLVGDDESVCDVGSGPDLVVDLGTLSLLSLAASGSR
jgi:hypothetical protein